MTLEEFRNELVTSVKASSSEYSSEAEEFVNIVSTNLIEAEEIIDPIIYLHYETRISRRKIQIDGYDYNDNDDVLTIFIVPTLEKEMSVLSYSEAKNYFEYAQRFIEYVEKIKNGTEESSFAYGFSSDLISNYKRRIKKYKITILTDKLMSKNIKHFEKGIIDEKPVLYNIWDINRLYELKLSRTGKEDLVIDLTKFTDDGKGIKGTKAIKANNYTAYLFNIPGLVLARLYNEYGSRLLEGNIRSFLQLKGKINKQIVRTISSEPEMFFAYNNGITVTAVDIKTNESNGYLYLNEITSMQIVNGGQTTASLATFLYQNKYGYEEEKLKNIFVAMKLSVINDNLLALELIPEIAKYANSQNPVNLADLDANHPFHIKLEDFSRRISAPSSNGRQYQTYWFYERARGQYKQATYRQTEAAKKEFERFNPKFQMFTKIDLAKYENIFDEKPYIASAGGQKSYYFFSEKMNKDWEADDSIFNEFYYKRLIAKAIIFKTADDLIKQTEWGKGYKANTIAYSLSLIIHLINTYHYGKSINYLKIWNEQSLSSSFQKQIILISKQVYYNLLLSDDRYTENVSEWAKQEKCWEKAVKMDFNLQNEFVNELIYEDNTIICTGKELLASMQEEIKGIDRDVWKRLIDFGYIAHKQKEFILNTVLSNSLESLNRIQCETCLKILKKAKDKGFNL